MIQNIRVDVLYYRVPTDFEMEFNLSGCCKMRLLTDKASDKKSLVSMLARDVARSRIIICCGPLFSDMGLIKIISSAIGMNTAVINNADYNINDGGEISVIESSTPLVSSDGIFGGCIISSGPQTIILLTENRLLRKRLMKEQVHDYIERVSIGDVKVQEAHTDDEDNNAVAEADNDTAEDFEGNIVINQDTDTETNDEKQPEINVDTELNIGEKTEMTDKHTVPFEMDEDFKKDDTQVFDENGINEDYYFDEEQKAKGKNYNAFIIVLTVMLILLIGVIAYLVIYVPLSNGQNITEYIRSLFGTVSDGGFV